MHQLEKSELEDCVYMSGLYLEGAAWHLMSNVLMDQKLEEMLFKMPIVLIRPQEKDLFNQASFSLDSPHYECPVYRSPARRGTLSTTGTSTNFVVYIALPCGPNTQARTWVKRGTALLCEPPA